MCFWRHIFRTFYAFGVPRVSQIGAFWVHFENFFVIGWISENDALARVSARFSRFQGFPKSHIFGVFLGMHFKCLFRTLFFDFLWFFMILGVPLGSIWRPSGELKSQIKAPFSPEAPRRVSGKDLGTNLDGFQSYVCICLTLCLMLFGLIFSIALYIGYVLECVWSGYGICIILAWTVPGSCGGSCRNIQGNPKENLRIAIGKLWRNHRQT